MNTEKPDTGIQKKFDFPAPRPRPFLSNISARFDSYEDGIASYFRWRTGLDYYSAVEQLVDFVINTKRIKVVDLLTDTGTFALRLAGRKGFPGRVYSYDSNITLLERARQRAKHLNVDQALEFKQSDASSWPIPDGFAEVAVSMFDFHRHDPEQFLSEAARIVMPEGHLVVAEMLEPKTWPNRCRWLLRKLQLKYVKKNPAEADGAFYDHDEVVRLLFAVGFRQVIIQELKVRQSPHQGIFSLIAATK